MKVVWHSIQSDSITGSGHRLPPQQQASIVLERDDRELHEASHGPPCWCDGLDDEQFFDELYDRCLKPGGFGCHPYKGKRVITSGTDVQKGRTAELERAIRDSR